jgi:hypothetical protein
MRCFFCDELLEPFEPGDVPRRVRLAFDPRLGRLWEVCARCGRWNPVPLEDRWETLEACERLARRDGRLLVEGEHLALLAVGDAQLVRVGETVRPEFSDWRYSRRLDAHPLRRPGILTRMLASLPERSAGGVSLYGQPQFPPTKWILSPFQEHADLLTALFLHVPLAEACPECGAPLAVEPSAFGDLRLLDERPGPRVVATCALCGATSALPLGDVRATLRVALAVVDGKRRDPIAEIGPAAAILDRAGGPEAFVRELGREGLSLGAIDTPERIALAIGLDEEAEAEALEAEWKEAEEVAAIMDGELTEIPGFEAFRRKVLDTAPRRRQDDGSSHPRSET